MLVAEGVVHVIDGVLNPSATTVVPDPAAPTQSPAFSGASSVSDNPLTSGIPEPSTSIGARPTPASSPEAPPPAPASEGAAAPLHTAAVEVAALLAGAGIILNL